MDCPLQYYFDEFFMCYTPKSQLRNWYRYGEKKDCGERWKDLKFCMQARMVDTETSQAMLQRREVERLKEIRSRPNSEDVWDIRTENLIDPFKNKQDGVTIS